MEHQFFSSLLVSSGPFRDRPVLNLAAHQKQKEDAQHGVHPHKSGNGMFTLLGFMGMYTVLGILINPSSVNMPLPAETVLEYPSLVSIRPYTSQGWRPSSAVS